MPLLVVGADHAIGEAIVRQTLAPGREVRAFVTDPAKGAQLKVLGAKVAIGDLSDEGHIAAAATRCFAIAFVLDAIMYRVSASTRVGLPSSRRPNPSAKTTLPC